MQPNELSPIKDRSSYELYLQICLQNGLHIFLDLRNEVSERELPVSSTRKDHKKKVLAS